MNIVSDSDGFILKIFQNAINMLCHDIANPVNSIMLCASSFHGNQKNSQLFSIIDDSSKNIIHCLNIARYSYCMTNNEYSIGISQIIQDWSKVFHVFEIHFDKNIKELKDFLAQIIFHILIFIQEFIDSKTFNSKIFISHVDGQAHIIFEKKLNEVIFSQTNNLIFENLSKVDINPMNVNVHFLQYLIRKNGVKISFDEKGLIIRY